jgi:DNA-binding MarR family transcriptional regulator
MTTMAPRVRTAELADGLRGPLLRLTRLMRQERSDASVPIGQLAALGTVHHYGPLTAGELADREQMQPPSMTKIIAALEDRGLVQRAVGPIDRRQVLISSTQAGRELVLSTRRARTEWLARRLALLTADERAVLRAAAPVLEKLARR